MRRRDAQIAAARQALGWPPHEEPDVEAQLEALAAKVVDAVVSVPDESRGRCPVCTGDFTLLKDGTLRHHLGDKWEGRWRQTCEGVGRLPRGAEVDGD
jgi:hypothetical protein